MNTQAMSSTCHKMWCHLHNIFQQSWMRCLPHGACVTLVMVEYSQLYNLLCTEIVRTHIFQPTFSLALTRMDISEVYCLLIPKRFWLFALSSKSLQISRFPVLQAIWRAFSLSWKMEVRLCQTLLWAKSINSHQWLFPSTSVYYMQLRFLHNIHIFQVYSKLAVLHYTFSSYE